MLCEFERHPNEQGSAFRMESEIQGFRKLIERSSVGLRPMRFMRIGMTLPEGLWLLPDRRLPIGQKQINTLCLPREILFRIGSLLLTWSKYTCKVFTPIAVCHISLGCTQRLCLPRRWEPSYWGGETIVKIPSGGIRLHSIAWTTPLRSAMVYGIN